MEQTEAARRWQEILKEFERQGVTRREFCEAKGVKLSTFAYWRTRFRKLENRNCGMVKIASLERQAEPIRIRVGEQIVVELDGNAGEEQLRRVLKAAAGL